jgi:hypothetical protein
MKESRVVALTYYTLRTKTGRVRVEDDGHRWTPGAGLPPKGVRPNAALALCRHASACDTCFHESAAAYSYCQANLDGTYVGCNFTHQCSPNDTATSIYRLECQLNKNAARR